ncbi:MAG: PQQ-dependent sugar dehydrogenase [Gemmatimonadales bacterium]
MSPVLLVAMACVAPGDRPADSYPDSLFTFQRVGGNALVVRRGFSVREWATDLPDARGMALAPDGAVWVALKQMGRVVRLQADGTRRDMFAGLRTPHGIAFRGDTVWIGETHQVIRSAPPYERTDTVVRGLPEYLGHNTRTLAFLGDTLLVSIGSSCNLCDERDPRRATIMAYDLDGRNERPYATGLRNSVGLVRHPATGTLWATNNDRDRLGDDLPPDRVNRIVAGGWYGWPQCYLPDTPNPEYRAQAERCADAIGPAIELPAHTAPLGLTFWRGALYIALHGSWDRSFPVGYKIVRVPFADSEPAGPVEDFIVGWQVGRQAWGRPVDVLPLPDGSLLISDDQGGRIYRVTPEEP